MRPALWSVAIQAAGSAATLGAALLVSSQLGLAAQGEFGLLRSWSDALSTLAVIGLPQGLLHMQYREGVSAVALRAWVMRYINALLAVLIVLLMLHQLLLPAAWTPVLLQGPQMLWAMLLTVVLGASHLLWRALALRDVGLLPYAALTAAPSLIILAALVAVCAIGQRAGLVWALLAGALLSSLASAWVVRRVGRRVEKRAAKSSAAQIKQPWSRRTLWSVSSQTGLQNIFTALSPPLVLSTASALGASLSQVGVLSLGLHVYQIFGVAAVYIAPMVYDKAARSGQAMSEQQLIDWMRTRLTWRAVLAFALMVVAAMFFLRTLWPTGADSWVLVLAMASAGVLSMAVRLMVTLMQARGAYRALSWHALGRLLLSVSGSAALMQVWPVALAVPLALLATELILLVWVWRLMQVRA
ncbi:MAG: hypothetical protein H7143_11270 [Pseudorhodobacter sp.]|nr:hypothetical protein [Rhizobacter sp.]